MQQLAAGATIAHPTEAIIGLAVSAYDRDACVRLRVLKGRPAQKPFLVVTAQCEQLLSLVSFDVPYHAEILASWPGPHTWILPAVRGAPAWLKSPTGHIAVRVTAHPQMSRLCTGVGPLVSTSANPAGRRPAHTLLTARRYFGELVVCYLVGEIGTSARPSTIRDGVTGKTLRV